MKTLVALVLCVRQKKFKPYNRNRVVILYSYHIAHPQFVVLIFKLSLKCLLPYCYQSKGKL